MNSKPAHFGLRIALLVGCVLFLRGAAFAQTTTFTYQGKLTEGGNSANGSYDLQFALFDNVAGGSQIGSTLTRTNTNVSAGIFTVQLDFGVNAFPGGNRFLEIGVRPTSIGSFTILSPRQQINSTPYAIRTLSAANADTATNSIQLGGVAASQYVQTNDSRLSDSRAPTAGSPNYVQNTSTQQNANFNISGNGTVGGNLGIGTNNPTSRVEIADRNGLAITGVEPFLTLRDTASNGRRSIIYADNGNFRFYPESFIGGAPAVVIHDDGRVGIGTSQPTALLEVRTNAAGQFGFQVLKQSGASAFIAREDGSVHVGGDIVITGNAGIGTVDPQRLLHVNGRARIGSIPLEAYAASVCFNALGDLLQCGASSLKLKTNVAHFTNGLDIIRKLRPITFDWKDGSGHDIGLGAEDVAKVAPSFTFSDDKGEVSGVKYERLNILLINAIKEQQNQIAQLKARLHRLEKRSTRSAHR